MLKLFIKYIIYIFSSSCLLHYHSLNPVFILIALRFSVYSLYYTFLLMSILLPIPAIYCLCLSEYVVHITIVILNLQLNSTQK